MKHKVPILLRSGSCSCSCPVTPDPSACRSSTASNRKADCIMRKESGYNPRAVSPTGDYGLFQINQAAWYSTFQRVTGKPWSYIFNPYWNASFARWIYDRSGWAPWTTNRLC